MDRSVNAEYTSDEILLAIHLALVNRDMPAVAALTRRLATLDPDAAQAILDTLDIARSKGPRP
jgi:hypothetical protein